jgi:ADP-heptose:LPS heptosyltransferase
MIDKNFKIFGMGYGVIGDLIMSLPLLNYFEKKHPGSYKYWVIEKKCSQSAPIYFNHPLIDRVKITDNWDSFGQQDKLLISNCDIVMSKGNGHKNSEWYNEHSCIQETADARGNIKLEELLTEEEMKPKLYKWFDVGIPNARSTYSKEGRTLGREYHNNISIWPFAGSDGRSPSPKWWNLVIDRLIDEGYSVCHYGMPSDPKLSDKKGYYTYPQLSYFDQVKAALASRITIGTDSGAMWVMGAYSHPSINLMTNWLPNHNRNFMALEPINDNGETFFAKGGCDNISTEEVVSSVKRRARI